MSTVEKSKAIIINEHNRCVAFIKTELSDGEEVIYADYIEEGRFHNWHWGKISRERSSKNK